jgi:regulator of extracellular matrix RemA (YlzA/DUF370 family)
MSNKAQEIVGRLTGGTLNVGHGNFLVAERIVAILESGSLPMKRLREKASEQNLLVDATAGRKMRSLIVTDSNHVILSALAPQTVQERLQEGRSWLSPAQLELEEGEFIS